MGAPKAKDRSPGLTHVGADGRAAMVDVGGKVITERVAVAEAFVKVSPELARRIEENQVAKGDVLGVARLAGIMAAKKTSELIPLCHPLTLDVAEVQVNLEGERVRIRAEVRTHARTGVEMEALTATAVAALTVIDMGKAVDKGMVVEGLRVLEKRGGKSGEYRAGTGEDPTRSVGVPKAGRS
jgi:cyclic pyranopterin monophosphate synthase